MRTLVCVILAGALAGCGLDTDGLATDDAGDDSGEPAEASVAADAGAGADGQAAADDGSVVVEGSTDAPGAIDEAAAGCLATVPSGWSIVAYETTAAACPAGYGAAHDERSGATAATGACPCSCQITATPNCTAGTLPTYYGNGAGCSSQGESIPVNGGVCTALTQAGILAQSFEAPPIALSGGSCSGVPQPDPSQVTAQAVRYCDVPAASAGAVCEGTAPAGFAACIESAGDVACPTGTPFSNRSVVADTEKLSCSACATCLLTGTCSSPEISFYADTQCAQLVVQLPSNGTCVSSGANNRTVVASEYSAQANASCQASGSTPSITPLGQHTLCCR
jgi:hypothetical protein